jgi:hypothetical protein
LGTLPDLPLARRCGNIGGQRQQRVNLVGIGDQINDDLHVLFQALDVVLAGGK